MNTYKVLSNLRHDGEVYKKGDTIELDKSIGDPLARDGVLADKNAKEEEDAVPLAQREKKDKKPEVKKEAKGDKKPEVKNPSAKKEEDKKKDKEDAKGTKETKGDDKSDEL